MNKLKFFILFILINSCVYGEWKTNQININDKDYVSINYNSDNINMIYDSSYLSSVINDINKRYDIVNILDENDVYYDKSYVDFIQIINIAKFYGGAYGEMKDYKFEIVPCYILREKKLKIYTILYKERKK